LLKTSLEQSLTALVQENHGALFMWFDPGVILKNTHTPLATFATPATFWEKNSKTEGENRRIAKIAEGEEQRTIIVLCYSLSGLAYEVEATSSEHAAWLLKMNPKPKGIHP
jgi:hypothetical protein